MMKRKVSMPALLTVCALFWVVVAIAAPPAPQWMPNFPMRMGPNVMLMWMPVPGATEYKVIRTVEGGESQEVMKGPMNNYMDPNLPQDKTYLYTVIAVAGAEASAPSPEGKIVGVKPMDPPKGLVARKMGEEVALRWSPVSGAAFYNLFKQKKGDADFSLLGSVQDTKYTDAGVEAGNVYAYAVSAVSAASLESPRSEPVEIELVVEKVVEVKKFDFKGVEVARLKVFRGEQGYEMAGPTDVEIDANASTVCVSDLNGAVQVFDLEGNYTGRFASPAMGIHPKDWGKPAGLGLDHEGRVWVTFVSPAALRLFDRNTGDVVEELTYQPSEETQKDRPGTVWSPGDVAVDREGKVWVSDATLRQIVVFKEEGEDYVETFRVGNPIHTAENKDKEEEILVTPGFIRVNPAGDVIWVVEMATGKIKAFDLTGKYLRFVGGRGPGLHNFSGPKGFDFDAEGNLLVGDGIGNSIKAINPENGDYLYSLVNDLQDNKYTLDLPMGIAYHLPTKKLFVTNSTQNQVTLLNVKR